jgi:hypothetical protein
MDGDVRTPPEQSNCSQLDRYSSGSLPTPSLVGYSAGALGHNALELD